MGEVETSRRTFISRGLAVAGLAGASMLGLEACAAGGDTATGNGRTAVNLWIGSGADPLLSTTQQLADTFTKANPNIEIKIRTFTGYLALLQALQVSVAAGQAPDVAWIGYNHLRYVATVLPVVPIADLGVKLDGYEPNIRALGEVKGKQIGAPFGLSDLVVFYNADLLAAAGVDADNPPATWSAWHDAATKIKSAKGVPAINLQQFPGDNFVLQAMVESNGGTILGCSSGHHATGLANSESIQAVEFMARMLADGLSLNVQAAQASQAFLAGETATLITGSSATGTLVKQANFRLKAASFPSFEGKARRLPGGGNALCSFAKTSTNKTAAAKVINFMTSAESLDIWTKATGYLSPRADIGEAASEFERAAIDGRKDLVPWTSYPGQNGLQGAQVISDAVAAVLGGQDSAQTRLTAAAKTIDSLFGHEPC